MSKTLWALRRQAKRERTLRISIVSTAKLAEKVYRETTKLVEARMRVRRGRGVLAVSLAVVVVAFVTGFLFGGELL